jgi:hypothetical protein
MDESSQHYWVTGFQSSDVGDSPVQIGIEEGQASPGPPSSTTGYAKRVSRSGFNDTSLPGAINDLRAATGTVSGSIQLSWTSSGDDGAVGTAKAYVVKYSTSLIDDANFDAASTVSQSWTPQVSGSGESQEVSGLTPSQTYFFAIKAVDEMMNGSAISNVVSAVAAP